MHVFIMLVSNDENDKFQSRATRYMYNYECDVINFTNSPVDNNNNYFYYELITLCSWIGMTAGGSAAIIGNPTEVALVRMTLDGRYI